MLLAPRWCREKVHRILAPQRLRRRTNARRRAKVHHRTALRAQLHVGVAVQRWALVVVPPDGQTEARGPTEARKEQVCASRARPRWRKHRAWSIRHPQVTCAAEPQRAQLLLGGPPFKRRWDQAGAKPVRVAKQHLATCRERGAVDVCGASEHVGERVGRQVVSERVE